MTAGVTLTGVVGPLDFAFGDYKVLPDSPPAATANVSATPVRAPAADEFTVGSTNLLNFFATNANFGDRLQKASRAIREVMRSPDIIGVQEVGDLATLEALALRLNADSGSPSPIYQAYLLEGSDEFDNDIDVGFLVKTSRVTVDGITQYGKGVQFDDPSEPGDQDTLFERPPLALRATLASPSGTPFPVTVVVNHPQSLIGVELDEPRGVRQRLKRKLQAEFTASLVQDLQAEHLILIGDFNSFQFNDGYVDVIGTIKGTPAPADQVVLSSQDFVEPDLTALVDTSFVSDDQRYSYVFSGNAQAIDHVLVDDEMLRLVRGFAYARNNADFPEAFANDVTRSERTSDHDMPVAYFALPAPPVLTLLGPNPMTVEACTSFADPGATASDAIFGDLTSAIQVTGSVDVQTPGTYTLVYTVGNGFLTSTATRIVNVADTTGPSLSGQSASPNRLWPPNHKLVDVFVGYDASETCGSASCTLSVASNEPVNGGGDGNTAPDWEVVDAHRVRVRAERAGGGSGRVYTITIRCSDAAGNVSTRSVSVTVPKSQGK